MMCAAEVFRQRLIFSVDLTEIISQKLANLAVSYSVAGVQTLYDVIVAVP
jgi:hypothetical protein